MLSQLHNPDISENTDFYTSEVLLCLQFLHSKFILYRDLKPENIMISMEHKGHIKLIDFGFAKQLSGLHDRTRTKCGSPAYIAPEIIKGDLHSYEVDIWSFGVLIYELLTGKTPFHDSSTA